MQSMGYAHGIRWTDELIQEKVLEVKKALDLDRMPSRKECEQYFHNEALVNAVSKRIGWYALANKMGLKIKDSETYFGKSHEQEAFELLSAMGFSVRKMAQNFPYDLLVDDSVKIDVKASHLYSGKNGAFYTFNLEKDYATCDIYLLFALNDKHERIMTFIVPSKFVISQCQISIGKSKSKYHRFIDRWDYIEAASFFWDNLPEAVI